MKNQLLIIALILCVNNVVISQITTTKIAEKKEEATLPYDSLRNFVGKDVMQYIGQELYVNEKSMGLRKYGYEGFYKDYKKSTSSKSNTYKCCGSSSSDSKYTELAKKYFKVINVIKHPKASEIEVVYGSKYFLELKEKETGSKVYYEYDAKYEHSFPFLVTGFFIKQKELNINREFIVKGKNWETRGLMMEMNTGEPVSFDVGSKWKCVDATLEEKYYDFILILENDKGEKIPLSLDQSDHKRYVFYADEAEKYKERFGEETWNTILNEKLIVGMTEEMVRLSWGKPKKINRSSDRDQWVYKDQYIYFENGKMTSFN